MRHNIKSEWPQFPVPLQNLMKVTKKQLSQDEA